MTADPQHDPGAAQPWREALKAMATAYAQDRLSAGELTAQFRRAAAERGELPPRFRQVLEKLLEPLEASALFSEESCAFSRTDLAQGLHEWVRATERLPMQRPGA